MRPNTLSPITFESVKPGDIILSAGPIGNFLDDLIREIDQSAYSHTTLFIGMRGNQPMVVEATTSGIIHDTIKRDWDEQAILDVYRFRAPDGSELGDSGWPAEPILANALSYVGGNYCYSELLMCAVAILAVDESNDPVVKEIVRLWGARIEYEVEQWLRGNSGKIPMTCVQVATTSFYHADNTPYHKYGIEVRIDGTRHSVPIPDHVVQLRAIKAKLKSALDKLAEDDRAPITVKAGSYYLPPGTCTPRDLTDSPSLHYIGTLKDTVHHIGPAKWPS